MTFIIPKGGVTVHVGKRLVSYDAGEHNTTDKAEIEVLKLARGVTVKKSNKPAKAPE